MYPGVRIPAGCQPAQAWVVIPDSPAGVVEIRTSRVTMGVDVPHLQRYGDRTHAPRMSHTDGEVVLEGKPVAAPSVVVS